MNTHITPNIGSVPLQQLTGAQINRLYAALDKDSQGEGTLCANSVRRVHATVHRALRDAVRRGYLSRNPAENADPPRQKDPKLSAVRCWQAEDLKTFLDSQKDDRLYPLWFLLALTGLRRGHRSVTLDPMTVSVLKAWRRRSSLHS